MSEKDRKEIAEMVKKAKYLAENDPQGFMLAKNSMDILKARSDMDAVEEKEEKDNVLEWQSGNTGNGFRSRSGKAYRKDVQCSIAENGSN